MEVAGPLGTPLGLENLHSRAGDLRNTGLIPGSGRSPGGRHSIGCYHGCRKAGLFCVPASSGNTERQIKLMRDFRVKGFCSVVSYVPRIIEKLDADPSGNHDVPSLRVGIFGSETFSDEMRKRIEDRLHIEARPSRRTSG